MPLVKCPECVHDVSDMAATCPQCGYPLRIVPEARMPPTPNATTSAADLMWFETNKKSVGLAYAFWLFLGVLGGHRFYAGRPGTAILMACLTVFALAALQTSVSNPYEDYNAVVGLSFGALGIWLLIDAFMLGTWITAHNTALISRRGITSYDVPASHAAAGKDDGRAWTAGLVVALGAILFVMFIAAVL